MKNKPVFSYLFRISFKVVLFTFHIMQGLVVRFVTTFSTSSLLSEFCTNEITERQFKHSVACLNQNILYLCFSQSVAVPERLDPRNTLQNIAVLLSCPSLGR